MNSFSMFEAVPLSSIDLENTTFRLTPWEEPCSEKLLASIKRYGILHPPTLKKSGDTSYYIVSGRKRITATGLIGRDNTVMCRTLQYDTQQNDLFSFLLEDNLTGKKLSVVEQIFFFEKLLHSSSIEDALPMLERLGHKPQKQILTGLIKLRSLCKSALRAMHAGIINQKNAQKLLRLNQDDQKIIVRFIIDLHLGVSKQQKLIDLSTELIKRNNSSLEEILSDFSFENSQEKPVNIPQQGTALLSMLHSKCFPQVTNAENDFKRHVKRLRLPPSMQLFHTPAFENEQVTLSIRLKDLQSADSVIETIKNLIKED